ncbi:MAG: prepilin-type N-terminal cleavage/methylation domain-containing protein [Candidatus Omnitrophica bacterium]|nr:prepilin-type N-terminal cleavage/methylation domain-containing protein [Candidatus Omnitrophota bacterium]
MKKGLTLIELLIATTIFALVSIAVYGTFNSGMSVWRRANELNLEQRRFMIRLEKFSRELRQVFNYPNIDFLGSEDGLSFAQVLDSEIVRVTYYFDQDKEALLRGVDNLPDILELEEGEELRADLVSYLSGIDELNFSYFYFDIEEESYLWKEEWVKENSGLPIAIKLEITTKDKKNYAETVFIPTA